MTWHAPSRGGYAAVGKSSRPTAPPTDIPASATMARDYVPTTEEIRRSATRLGAWSEGAFDRWLAEHDRRVAEDVWEDGYLAAVFDALEPVSTPATVNPYRARHAEGD